MKDFGDYIKQETLSLELVEGVPPEGAYTESFKLGDSIRYFKILLGVEKKAAG